MTVTAKSNWTETFELRNGWTIKHTPERLLDNGGAISAPSVNFQASNVSLNISWDLTRAEFVQNLRNTGNL